MATKTTTLRIDARDYEDEDDCLGAAARRVADDLDLCGWDLRPRWEDDAEREAVLVDVPEAAAAWALTHTDYELASARRLHGREAIEYAERTPGATLCHYTTPLEEAREGVSLEVAREIVREDPGLVYVDVQPIR